MKIYLAEDDTDDVNCFKEALREICKESTVAVFNNGEELLEKLKDSLSALPNFILLDINMPVMNGLECLKQLRSKPQLKDIPVIILTTSSSRTTIEITYRLGANYFIKKPSDYKDLKRMLRSILQIDWRAYSRPANSAAFVFNYL